MPRLSANVWTARFSDSGRPLNKNEPTGFVSCPVRHAKFESRQRFYDCFVLPENTFCRSSRRVFNCLFSSATHRFSAEFLPFGQSCFRPSARNLARAVSSRNNVTLARLRQYVIAFRAKTVVDIFSGKFRRDLQRFVRVLTYDSS